MLIYEVLETDHLKLRALIFELIDVGERGEVRRAKLLVDEIHDELVSHARAEEATLYTRLTENRETEPLVVFNGFQDHIQAEILIKALKAKIDLDAEWKVLVHKLHETIETHVEKEETEVFGAARTFLTDDEARSLASSFERFKPVSKLSNWIEDTLSRFVHLLEPHRAARLRALALKSKKITQVNRSHERHI